jgi:hypothetical protein
MEMTIINRKNKRSLFQLSFLNILKKNAMSSVPVRGSSIGIIYVSLSETSLRE